jgi:hypothetical protein
LIIVPTNSKTNDAAATQSQTANNQAGDPKTACHATAQQALQDVSERKDAMHSTSQQTLESSQRALAFAGSDAVNQKSATDAQQANQIRDSLDEFANRQRDHLGCREDLINKILADAFSSVSQLQETQQREREACPAGRQDMLQERHEAQWAAMQTALAQVDDGVSALRARDDERLRNERVEVQRSVQDPTQLAAQLDISNDRTDALRDSLMREAGALNSDLSRETGAAQYKMGEQERNAWRDALAEPRLRDDAIERIHQTADKFASPDADTTLDRIKGRIIIEIANSQDLDRAARSQTERQQTAAGDTAAQSQRSAQDAAMDAAFSPNAQFQVGAINEINRERTTRGGDTLLSLDSIALTAQQERAAREIHGQQLSPDLQRAWDDCINPREQAAMEDISRLWNANQADSQQQARDMARDAFDLHRGRFWSAVRGDEQLRAAFEDAGMQFGGGRTTAPTYTLPDDSKVRMTLEHSTRLADDPTSALRGSNLQLVLNDENSYFLEQLRAKDPFQRPGQSMSADARAASDARDARQSEEQQQDRDLQQRYLAVDITAAELDEMARRVQELMVQENIKSETAKAERDKEARERAQRAEDLEDQDA